MSAMSADRGLLAVGLDEAKPQGRNSSRRFDSYAGLLPQLLFAKVFGQLSECSLEPQRLFEVCGESHIRLDGKYFLTAYAAVDIFPSN